MRFLSRWIAVGPGLAMLLLSGGAVGAQDQGSSSKSWAKRLQQQAEAQRTSEAEETEAEQPEGGAAPPTEPTPAPLMETVAPATQEQEPEFKRPKYSFLRQNENWSGLADFDRSKTGDRFDPIKYVPLNDDGSIWASFGGSIQLRGEWFSDFNFGAPATADDEDVYLLSRLRLHGDLHVGDHLRVYTEFKTANSTGRDLIGGNRGLDVDTAALQQAFADIRVPVLNDDVTLTVRAGRQMLLFGKQRLVSPLPWANTLRTWDGASAILEGEGFKLHAFLTQFAPVQKYRFNDVNRNIDFYGGYLTTKVPTTDFGWDLYFLGLERTAATFNGTTGAEDRYTFGTRIWGNLSERVDFEVETAWQAGEVGNNAIEAGMFTANLGLKLPDLLAGSRAWVGFDYATGDETPGGEVQTFSQLFPLGHAYLGFADVLGRQNIIDASTGIDFKVTPKLSGMLHYHSFWVADNSDALYNVGGGVSRAGGASTSSYVGSEVDLILNYVVNRHLKTQVGYARFFAGDLIEDSGPSDDIDFAYAQAIVFF